MKKEKILAAVVICAVIAASAGCGGNKPASTTTASEAVETTTTTAAAETTTTTAATTTAAETTEAETTAEEGPMEMTAPLFGRGVWEVYDGDKLDSYYVFYDETSGVIIGAEYIEYVPFTCEQDGTEIMFHLGGDDNNTPAVFDLGDATGTFTFGESEKAYRFAALDTDVDEFLKTNTAAIAAAQATDEENPVEMTAPLFGRGVWEVYDGDTLDSYYVFYDETSGVIIGAEYIEYVPFTCEQDGTEIMFHLGGDDNNTPAVFDLGDATGTFTFGESEKAYRFAALDTDVDEFLKTNTAAIAAAQAAEEANPMEMTAPLFGRGVWEVYDGDMLDSYYVFYDETSGMIIGAEHIETVPFTCEQNGTEIMFHLGGDDNNTPAVFDLGDATGTFTFGEIEKSYRFAALDTDVDEFLETHGFIA